MKKKQSAASTTGGSRRRNAPITMQMRRRCYEEEERKKKESKLKQGSGVCVGACRHRLSFAPLSSVRPAQRRKGRALFSSFFISSSTFFLFIEFPSLFSPRQHTQKQNRKFRHTQSLFSSLSSSLIQSHLSSQAIWWSFATRQCNQYQPKSRGNQTGYSTTTLISMLFQSLFRRKMNWKWRQTPQSRSLSLYTHVLRLLFFAKKFTYRLIISTMSAGRRRNEFTSTQRLGKELSDQICSRLVRWRVRYVSKTICQANGERENRPWGAGKRHEIKNTNTNTRHSLQDKMSIDGMINRL